MFAQLPDLKAQEIGQLQHRDHHRDPRREAEHHRIGHVLNEASQAGEAQRHQDYPGHHRGDQQAAQAVLLDDGEKNDDEGRRGTRDIEA